MPDRKKLLGWTARIALPLIGLYFFLASVPMDAQCAVCRVSPHCDPGYSCILRHVTITLGLILMACVPAWSFFSGILRGLRGTPSTTNGLPQGNSPEDE